MRAAGATIIIDKQILPESFFVSVRKVNPQPYRKEGLDRFLQNFGPAQYHSVAEYEAATGNRLPLRGRSTPQKLIETDPESEANFWGPQRAALAEYEATRKRWRLDGFVYPSLQVPTYDETVPGASKRGLDSETAWVNRIGVPAISVPGGFYADGLPFGLEISGVQWKTEISLAMPTRMSRQRTTANSRSSLKDRRSERSRLLNRIVISRRAERNRGTAACLQTEVLVLGRSRWLRRRLPIRTGPKLDWRMSIDYDEAKSILLRDLQHNFSCRSCVLRTGRDSPTHLGSIDEAGSRQDSAGRPKSRFILLGFG